MDRRNGGHGISSLERELTEEQRSQVPETIFIDTAAKALAAALCVRLHEAGWSLSAPDGAPVFAEREGARFEPFEVLGKVADGSMDEVAWRAHCAELGVDRL